MHSPKEILDNLLFLQARYSKTYRAMTSTEKYEKLVLSGKLTDLDLSAEEIREPLIEHVGHLPIIASYLHRFVEHKNSIDLGEVLIMLAVHDIGETAIGDMLTYAKTKEHALNEVESARSMLPD